MFDIKDAKAAAETLWSLKETLGALRESCDNLASTLAAQDLRIRTVENAIIQLNADIRISESNSKLAAVEKAVDSASRLISNVHGPMVQKISDMQSAIDSINRQISSQDTISDRSFRIEAPNGDSAKRIE